MPFRAEVKVSVSAGGAAGDGLEAALWAADDDGGWAMLGCADGAVDAAPVQPATRAVAAIAQVVAIRVRRTVRCARDGDIWFLLAWVRHERRGT
jgi:hypothetical protein